MTQNNPTATPSGDFLQIPSTVLAGINGWGATVVWAYGVEVSTWRLSAPGTGELHYLKVARLDRPVSLQEERRRMAWASAYLPVPRVLDYGTDGVHEWLLTTGLAGVNGIDATVLANPSYSVPLLATGLRQFHTAPVEECPFDSRATILLSQARACVAAGLVDPNQHFQPEHRAMTVTEALARLEQLCPQEEDLVVCHGDYCPPNVLIQGGQIVGYVDLGQLGVADRWWDIAVATWSVTWNFGPGWEDLFLKTYGVEADPQKIAFYRLLHDLLP